MAITYKDGLIKITEDGEYRLQDIVDTINDNNIVSKVYDNIYVIKCNLQLGNGSDKVRLVCKNEILTVEGEMLQIYKGSTLQLGEIEGRATKNGCTLNIPNVKRAYGFGCVEKDKSGNLEAYESIINAWGFWGFFEGSNIVKLIDCIIDGYGRISGINSILWDNLFKRSHGKYGTISTKGDIYINSGNRVHAVEENVQYIATLCIVEI